MLDTAFGMEIFIAQRAGCGRSSPVPHGAHNSPATHARPASHDKLETQ
jgi:hypothetical protein